MTKEEIYNLKRQRSQRLEAVKETIRGITYWKI
jgi:hypothetical protein